MADRRPADETVADLGPFVQFTLSEIGDRLARSASQLYRERFGVNVLEWRVMAVLMSESDVTGARIGQQSGLDKGPVSRVLARLAEAGYVEIARAERGNRHRVSLTAAGRAMYARIAPLARERQRRLLATLSEDEVDVLLVILAKLEAQLPSVAALLREDPVLDQP